MLSKKNSNKKSISHFNKVLSFRAVAFKIWPSERTVLNLGHDVSGIFPHFFPKQQINS